jgi:hypothetical protein
VLATHFVALNQRSGGLCQGRLEGLGVRVRDLESANILDIILYPSLVALPLSCKKIVNMYRNKNI